MYRMVQKGAVVVTAPFSLGALDSLRPGSEGEDALHDYAATEGTTLLGDDMDAEPVEERGAFFG